MADQEDLQSAIDNIHNSLIAATDDIVETLTTDRQFGGGAHRWVEYANQLKRLVPVYAIPPWLSEACNTFGEQFVSNRDTLAKLATFLTTRAPEIRRPIFVGEAATLNLEELFAEQAKRYQLNQVFENLVSRLSELIAADVIDNRIVHDSLKRLNALFRRTKSGSLSTVLLTMNFGRFFLKSFGDILKANKYAKPLIENFESEFTEASGLVQKAEEETKKEMVLRLINRERMDLFLESNPNLKETVAGFLPAPRENDNCEQDGADDQPATAPKSESEGEEES